MVFQGSDVPLEEDILKQPIEFVRSWLEWSADNREHIHRLVGGTATQTLFTVPDNNTFFITSATLSAINTSTVQSTAPILRIGGSSNTGVLITFNLPPQIVGADFPHGRVSKDFTFPLKIEAGQIIQSVAATGNSYQASIIGFLVPKQIAGRTQI